ncbi:retrovirus-related pol polyprotein from transposon TNT 1-94 [Tanacetum coccineum]
MPTTHDDEDLLQIDEDAMEEIDIRWQVAMITARIRKFMRKTGRPIDLKPKNGITFDKSKIGIDICYDGTDWIEQDDWSMSLMQEHVQFVTDGTKVDFEWSNKAEECTSISSFMATNSESCIGFGIESYDISSGDETLTDQILNFKKQAYKAVSPSTYSDDEETDVSESQKETVFNTENSEESFENKSPKGQNSVGQESRTKGNFGTKGSRVPTAVLSRSTMEVLSNDGLVEDLESQYAPSRGLSTTRTPHRPQRPKKIVKSIWVKKGSTVGSQAVPPQTVKKSAMISPKQLENQREISRFLNRTLFLWWNHFLVAKATRMKLSYAQKDWGMSTSKISTSWVKGNRLGLPSKTFKLDHSCVALERVNSNRDEFCAKKGIKREYSIARTPQQNGVAERKNRTLIEAARTMLADSLLPIQFWAEAVNTACYKENYADSKEQGISCDDVEDMDDQQFIVHTAQPMPPVESTAAKEVKLSSEDQALHDELVSLMHQESLAKAHNDDQRIAFEAEKEDIYYSDDDTPTDGVFSTNSFDAEEGGVADYNNLDSTIDVPSTPTLRIHKIHPQSQIIGKKPRKSSQAEADEVGLIAMQEELRHYNQATKLPELKPINSFWHLHLSWALLSSDDVKSAFNMATSTERCMSHSLPGLQVKQSNGGIFLSQDKYVKDILNKFDFRTIKPASTPIESHKSLGKDEEGEDVDVHLYSHSKELSFSLEAFRIVTMLGTTLDEEQLSGGDVQYLGRRPSFLAMQNKNKQLWLSPLQNRICSSCKLLCSGPWHQQFWATASSPMINDVPHIRAKVAGQKILISESNHSELTYS